MICFEPIESRTCEWQTGDRSMLSPCVRSMAHAVHWRCSRSAPFFAGATHKRAAAGGLDETAEGPCGTARS